MCPYMAGGRSRRGSPKAGTTVVVNMTQAAAKCDEGDVAKYAKLNMWNFLSYTSRATERCAYLKWRPLPI